MSINKLLILLIITVLPITNLKIGSALKLYEIVYLICCLLFLFLMPRINWHTSYIRKYYTRWLYIILLCLLVSLRSFYFDFFLPDNLGVLNNPIIITISRIFQLMLALSTSIILFNQIKKRDDYLFALKTYISIGIAICVYALVSGFFNYILGEDVFWGAYTADPYGVRLSGSFVEGGPFGAYLISLLFVEYAYFNLNRTGKWSRLGIYGISLITLFFTYSKAAFVVASLLILLSSFNGSNTLRSRTMMIFIALFLIVSLYIFGFGGLLGYYTAVTDMDLYTIQQFHNDDPNVMMGRIAAMYIIPNMINEHYLLGIGLGNYPLLRNKPEFSQGFPATSLWDNTGLGIIELAAEIGIPLTLILLFQLIYPVYLAKQLHLEKHGFFLAGFQVMAHLFGIQLTFIYPWIITTFFLSFIRISRDDKKERGL